MTAYISAADLTRDLLAMRTLLRDALKNDRSICGDLLREKRLGSLKTVNDVIEIVSALSRKEQKR